MNFYFPIQNQTSMKFKENINRMNKRSVEEVSHPTIHKKCKINNYVIYIKTLRGALIPLYVNSKTKLKDVKMLIEEKTFIPKMQQRLIHMGSILDDDLDLETCNITETGILGLIIRLKG